MASRHAEPPTLARASAVIPGASVTLENRGTGYTRTVSTDEAGVFRINNVPPNTYRLSVSASGFSPAQQSVDVRSSVPMNLKIPLPVGGATASVEISGG